MRKGTYSLVIELDESVVIDVGALGEVGFDEGHYAYTGSALGPGGFERVERHRRVSSGDNETRRWHVDYLNGHPSTSIRAVVKSRRDECDVARRVGGEPIDSFGSSDCGCDSHLVCCDDALASVRRAHAES